MKKLSTLVLSSAMILGGCGSMINGTTQSMSIQATPKLATIQLLSANGSLIAESNGSLFYNLNRSNGFFDGADYNLKISAPGYQDHTIPLTSSPSGWYIAGNIVLGGFLGWLIVDPISGGMWALDAPKGHDITNLKVTLLQDATDEMMSKAIKVQ